MKLAIIHNHPIHYKHLLFQELKKCGLEFKVFFLGEASNIRHEKLALSEHLYSSEIGFDGPYESAPLHTRVAFTWSSLSNYRPHVVIIGGYHMAECWAAWTWTQLFRRPAILWYESNEFDYPRRWYPELLKRIFLRGCERAHVYGASNRAYLMKLGMPGVAIQIKRAVVNVDLFSTSPSEKSYSSHGRKNLLYVGRLAPEKNISFLLRALSSAAGTLPTSALHLTISGSGPLEEQLKKECIELGIRDLVTFTGYVPQQELPSVLRNADFLVLPSSREPWGLVSLEAMLCRVPVLISTQCGCAEDVVTKDTGFKFSPWDEAAASKLLASLHSIPPQRIAAMGNAAHELASGYSAQECARRVTQSIFSLAPGDTATPTSETSYPG